MGAELVLAKSGRVLEGELFVRLISLRVYLWFNEFSREVGDRCLVAKSMNSFMGSIKAYSREVVFIIIIIIIIIINIIIIFNDSHFKGPKCNFFNYLFPKSKQ